MFFHFLTRVLKDGRRTHHLRYSIKECVESLFYFYKTFSIFMLLQICWFVKNFPFISYLFKIFQIFFLTSECLLTIILIVRWVFTYRRFKILFLMGYFLAPTVKLFFNNHSSKSIRWTNISQIISAIFF